MNQPEVRTEDVQVAVDAAMIAVRDAVVGELSVRDRLCDEAVVASISALVGRLAMEMVALNSESKNLMVRGSPAEYTSTMVGGTVAVACGPGAKYVLANPLLLVRKWRKQR